MTAPTISSLLSRVRAASGPDRELDLDIARALAPDVIMLRWHRDAEINEPFTHWRYTESIDAAVALVERVLSGWTWRVGNTPSGRGFCYLGTSLVEYDAATPPLAILAALLTALEQKESAG